MSLSIYENELAGSAFSQGNKSNSFTISFDGTTGGTIEKRLYVRNNDALFYYTGITVQPISLSGFDLVTDANSGFYWKLNAGDSQPLLAAWNIITAGAAINLSDLGSAGNPDTSTYLPFWVKISVPANTSIQVFENVTLRIDATETAI